MKEPFRTHAQKHGRRLRQLCVLLLVAAGLAARPQGRQLDIDSFDYVWRTVRDKHWDPALGGLDWQALRAEFRPKVEQAGTADEARALMNEMLARLGQSHFAVVPSFVYREMGDNTGEHGDYPAGIGETGMDVRVLERRAIVTRVEQGSPAADAGIRPGWEILSIRGQEVRPVIDRIHGSYAHSTLLDFNLRRAVLARLSGEISEKLAVGFLDGGDRHLSLEMALARPRGNRIGFGNLSPQFVRFESRMLDGRIGCIAFNLFLDPFNVMQQFGDAVQACRDCAGIIIDLRGNPGGIGAMSMGMAGWFISRQDLRLGVMYTRSTPLKFVVAPRPQIYSGPLAVLVDGCSVSTSEILAGGLKDLGRARIFGTRTGGAALPSLFERLPNGDGFQYAVAYYVSEGGKPLEGRGVIPDVEAAPSREALLEGRDPALEQAMAWIRSQSAGETPPGPAVPGRLPGEAAQTGMNVRHPAARQ